MILERYSDLFSDFDPRPYNSRTISDDFIDEVKKRVQISSKSSAADESDRNTLLLMMPEHKRNLDIEDQICTRVCDLFERLFRHAKKRVRAARIRGVIWVLLGSIVRRRALGFVVQDLTPVRVDSGLVSSRRPLQGCDVLHGRSKQRWLLAAFRRFGSLVSRRLVFLLGRPGVFLFQDPRATSGPGVV